MSRYAISDIHGCCDTFRKVVKEVIQLKKTDVLYLLGDYIDRGPLSKEVFDFIWQLQKDGYEVHCIRGNHEEMMLEALDNPRNLERWLRNGGKETLESFGVKSIYNIPNKYIKFVQDLAFYIELEDYLLVHAGFNFRSEDFLADKESMIWIRYWYDNIDREKLSGKNIVHGHTPTSETLSREMMKKYPVINIDGGCVYKGKVPELGYLCVLNLEDKSLFFQKNAETV